MNHDTVVLLAERQLKQNQFGQQPFIMPTTHPDPKQLAERLEPLLHIGEYPPVGDSPRLRAETLAKISEVVLETAIQPTGNKVVPLSTRLPQHYSPLLPYTRLMGATASPTTQATKQWLERQTERRYKAIDAVELSLASSNLDLPVLTVQEYLRAQPSLPTSCHDKVDRIINRFPSSILLPVGADGVPYLITAWDTDILSALFGFTTLRQLSYYQLQTEFNYAKGAKLTADPDYARRFVLWENPYKTAKPSNRMVFRYSYLREYLPNTITIQPAQTTKALDITTTDKHLFVEHLLLSNNHTLPLRARHVPREQMKFLQATAEDKEASFTYKRYTLKDYWGNEVGITISLFLDMSQLDHRYSELPKADSLKGLHSLLSPDHGFAGQLYYSYTIQTKRRKYNPQYKTPLDRILNNKRW